MEDAIIKFITGYIELSPEEESIIKAQNLLRLYPKNSILLSEGEHARECYFILKGCVRSFYLVEGEERTTEFYTENQSITPVSYLTGQPSEYYLSCLEESIVAIGTPDRNRELMEKIPKLGDLVMQMNSELLVQTQVSFDSFKNLNPETRYRKLLEERPGLFNRVPLQHIATYLGITPVSLSRMRKRISGKH